jgi:antitoxin (DNA-binding transcriptional repressor) of toxin-antitoxin stability system
MITVGVRDLKNQLSFYLQYVKNGEKVIVTEHDKVIAEINVPEIEDKYISIREKMRELSKEGDIILAKRTKNCVKLQKPKEKLDWESVYNEIRADRKTN